MKLKQEKNGMHKQGTFKDGAKLFKNEERKQSLTFLLQFLEFLAQLIFLFLFNQQTVLQILNLKIVCQQT